MHTLTRSLAAGPAGLFALTAAVDIPHDQATRFEGAPDYLLEALFAAALTVAAVALGTLLRGASGWPARAGWALAMLGTATLALVATATTAAGRDVFDPLFVFGLLTMLLGHLVLAVADLAKRVTPRYAGLVLLLGTVGMLALGDGYGLIAWAAGWVAVSALAAPVERSAGSRATQPSPA